jgi:hypothetical protein
MPLPAIVRLVIPAGDGAKTLLGLPIAALRLPKTMVEDLSILGFDRVGELAAKPRAPLACALVPNLAAASIGPWDASVRLGPLPVYEQARPPAL